MSNYKSVTVLELEQYGDKWPPENLNVFIAWAKGVLNSIPAEFAESATIEFDSESGYEGDHWASLRVRYRRPKTEQEIEAERKDIERLERRQDEKDRKELARLKAKYEPQQ